MIHANGAYLTGGQSRVEQALGLVLVSRVQKVVLQVAGLLVTELVFALQF